MSKEAPSSSVAGFIKTLRDIADEVDEMASRTAPVFQAIEVKKILEKYDI